MRRPGKVLGRTNGARTWLVVALLAVACTFGYARSESTPDVTAKQKGISLASWWFEGFSGPDPIEALDELAATGADAVAFVVTQYQDRVGSVEIRSTSSTVVDSDLGRMIDHAHDLGLQVMLKPHVDLKVDRTRARSQIGSAFNSSTKWDRWFASYTEFIGHYARLAARHGVEQFAVGTELAGTTHRSDDWKRVVASVRDVFHGRLTYAALGAEAPNITWWDAVDLIGVDAYYVLSPLPNPTIAQLNAGWAVPIGKLSTLAAQWDMPILFTEVGFRSVKGATDRPWDWTQDSGVDLALQARAYESTFESLFDEPWFAGMYWWLWDADPTAGGKDDTGFTPHCKPAEDVLIKWYGGQAPAKGCG